jgi:outer membrane protein assembly factor BamE (lipoprotein component of BamABCDE complex)
MKKTLAVLFMAVALGGCATNYGNTSITDQNKVAAIHVGKSTMKDVRGLLGKPANVTLDANGEQVWDYTSVNVKGTAMIPLVGLFGNPMSTSSLAIRFNRKGVVIAMGNGGTDSD